MNLDRLALPIVGVGLLAGLGSGFFGIGGGAVMVPGLVVLAHLTQHQAHANSLGAVIPIALVAVIPFAFAGEIDPVLAVVLAAGSLIGARTGARAMHRLSERQLRIAFAIVLSATALLMLLVPNAALLRPEGLAYIALGVVIGFVGGFASALLGIGGGLVLVPGMAVLLGVPQHLAQGTSLLTIIPTALVGARAHARSGLIQSRTVGFLAVGGVVGGLVAATIALEIDDETLRRAFAVYALVILLRILATDPAWATLKNRLAGRPAIDDERRHR